MRDEVIENGVRQTFLRDAAHGSFPPVDAFCTFCEALLRLDWPGRSVAVTPAPLSDLAAEAIDVRGVLDVTVGPLPDDPAWASFRVVVQDEVARREWAVAAAVLLETARGEFDCWRESAMTGRSR